MPDIGSSPLSQGTFVHILHLIVPLRLIPATAENTKRHRTHASSLRLIPARTGSIRVTRQTEAPTPAHPRSRGDYTRFEITRWSCKGSSPLARGTSFCQTGRLGNTRLIPARAGNTLKTLSPVSPGWDHPRLCGKHPRKTLILGLIIGSSPLARGTSPVHDSGDLDGRLIPAHAGNTVPGPSPHRPHGAHPRSRGEHGDFCRFRSFFRGSSPLARGTLSGRPHA